MTIIRTRFRQRLTAVAAATALFFTVAGAQALDYNDLRNLVSNNVSDSVILNMVQQDSNLAITVEEANELRRLGASESVVMSIPRLVGGSVIQPGGSTSSSTTTYVDPGTVYYQDQPSVIVQQPTYVVPSSPTYVVPSYSYPYYYDRGPSLSFSFGFGSGRDRWRPSHRPGRPGGGRPGGGRPGPR
ncbi:MAG: hypothetical protein LUG50_14455 [Planctomycetaceae bacterium]|nr:hypothetical protein [Planctomycetaceae bacterium]